MVWLEITSRFREASLKASVEELEHMDLYWLQRKRALRTLSHSSLCLLQLLPLKEQFINLWLQSWLTVWLALANTMQQKWGRMLVQTRASEATDVSLAPWYHCEKGMPQLACWSPGENKCHKDKRQRAWAKLSLNQSTPADHQMWEKTKWLLF